MKTGAAYIRVSTNMQEELSPDAQKRLIADYAEKNEIQLHSEYIFIENGISGKTVDKRPEFQRMIATAKSKPKPFDVILLWKFSRFARNQEEAAFYKGILRKKCGIDVVSITEPIIEGMYGRLIEMIIEWNDEFYSHNLSQEVMKGMTEKALRGGYQARPPLGYRHVAHKEAPVIVPEEAKIVQLIFDKYVKERMDLFSIARYLNGIGLKTNRGKPFEKRSVEYIIQNPSYIGKVRWNRTNNTTKQLKNPEEWIIADGAHNPIIDEETFYKANQRFRSEYTPKNAKPAAIRKHWLSGLLKCSACGRTLSSSMHTDKRYGKAYCNFQCYGYLKGKCTVSHGVSGIKIEEVIMNMLRKDLEGNNITYAIITPDQDSGELQLLQIQAKKLDAKVQRIKEAYRNGVDTLEEYKANKELLLKEKQNLHTSILAMQQEKPKESGDAVMLPKVSSIVEILISDRSVEDRNHAICSIVQKFIYKKETGEVDIYYYFS